MEELTIRNAGPSDQQNFLTILRIIREEMGHDAEDEGHLEELTHLLCTPAYGGPRHHWLLLAERGGELVGYCTLHRIPMPIVGGSEAYISDLFIRSDQRGHDIGHHMIDYVESVAKEEGLVRLHVINRRDRESHQRSFYPKLGFRERVETADFVRPL